MRVAFTILAVVLVALLSVALAAPYFIDWNGQRKQIEAQLSRILGSQITVAGPIDLKLLPVPYITLGAVHMADSPNSATSLDIDSAKLEMTLAALVRGQFRFTQASFEHPVLTTSRGPGGGFALPHFDAKARSDQIALDKIIVRNGSIEVAAAADAAGLAVSRIDLDAEADSLRGPFKGAGAANGLAPSRLSFRFATGSVGPGDFTVKGSLDAEGSPIHGEFDGSVSFAWPGADSAGVALSYSGAARLSGAMEFGDEGAQVPWSASGAAQADAHGADISNLELRLGEAERALIATGSAKAEFGARPALALNLESTKLDFDAMLRRQGEAVVPPARALEIVRRLIAGVGGGKDLPFRLSVGLTSPSAILGGDAIDDLAISASAGPMAPLTGRLECSPPGRSHLIASGIVELGSAEGFKGRIDAEIGDAQPLRDWLTQDAAPLRASLTALGEVLPYRSLALGGEFDISNAGFAARNLRLALEQTILNGTLAWTSALGAERSRLFMDLRSDDLALASLPNVGAANAYFHDSDLAVAVEAKALHVEHVGEANLSGGQMAVKVTKTGDNVAVERLSIKGLGGADVEAKGGADAKGTWLEGRLDAVQMRDFAALMRRVAPSDASDFIADRASALAPAKLTFKAQFAAEASEGRLTPVSLTLSGSAGATHVEAGLGRSASDSSALDANLSLDAPDVAPLLRQLGAPAQALTGKGRGQFSLTAHGRTPDGFETEAKATLAGVDLALHGHLQPEGGDDAHPILSGSGSLKAANAGPLLSVFGVAAPDLSLTIPASLDADIVWRRQSLGLAHLKGAVGAAKLSGELNWAAPVSEAAPTILDPDIALANALAGETASERAAQIEGRLTIDRLPVSALAGLALGPSLPAKPGALWSDAAFAPGLARTPTADIKLAISRLDLGDAAPAQNVAARVKIDPGSIKFNDLSLNLRGGAITGHAELRRSGASAAISGQIGFESLPFDTPSLAGQVSGSLDFAASGQNSSALVGDLAGQGQIRLAGVKAARLDPGALGRIVDKTQAPDYPIDQTNIEHALGIELDKQGLMLPDASVPAFLTNGTLRVNPVEAPGPHNRTSLSASVDLKKLVGQLHVAFSETQTTKYWTGAPPAISVDLRGPLDTPVRTIDSAAFAAGLAQQAIARESDRIAALEADMRERAAFNRRLKAEQFLRKREQELAAYALEQARLKSEQDRKRVEDATLKAAEDAKKAAEEAKRAEEAGKAEEARKAAEEAAKAAEQARKAAADASAAIAPPLPDEVPPPSFNMLPPPVFDAPTPPPKPHAPAAPQPDPTAGGLY